MRRHAVRHHDLAQHERAVRARGVGNDADRLQDAVRAAAFGLHGRAAVEAPERQLLERRKLVVFLDLRLAAQIGHRGVSVEPDVLELILCHAGPLITYAQNAKGCPRRSSTTDYPEYRQATCVPLQPKGVWSPSRPRLAAARRARRSMARDAGGSDWEFADRPIGRPDNKSTMPHKQAKNRIAHKIVKS